MGSDSVSITSAPVKELTKKKRVNRLTKLKQCKLDVRREQWLSQAKNKECKMDWNEKGNSPLPHMRKTDEQNRSLESMEIRSRRDENDGSSIHDSDLESLLSSPDSENLGYNDSSKYRPGSSSSSCSISISSAYCSISVSEEEDDDGCLDDWEAIADALSAADNRHKQILEPLVDPKTRSTSANPQIHKSSGNDSKTERKEMSSRSQVCSRAWRPDDALRPQFLPTLSNQHMHSFPVNLEHHRGHGEISLEWQSVTFQPSSCPICYEDLDLTDTSFLPCPCGFRLCLFCHKRIIEADGRCPGCRKEYDSVDGHKGFNREARPFQTPHSCSMKARS